MNGRKADVQGLDEWKRWMDIKWEAEVLKAWGNDQSLLSGHVGQQVINTNKSHIFYILEASKLSGKITFL